MRITSIFIVVFIGIEGSDGFSSKAKGFGASTASYKRTDEALTDFLKSHHPTDIQNVDIGIDQQSGNRGLFAAKTFGKADALLCKIPSDLALALCDPAATDDTVKNNVAEYGLTFYRQYYNKPAEWWKEYLQSLPSKIPEGSTTPNLWTADEMELLEFPRLVQQAHERSQQVQDVAQKESIALNDLQFATWLVSSRAFLIPISEVGQQETDDRGQIVAKASAKVIPVMVPLIDMANHNSNPNAKLTLLDPEKDDAFFCLTSTRPIQKGSEITIGYGSGVASSVELLLNYGFTVPGNHMDRLMLKKGGDDCFATPSQWTTSLEDDRAMLQLLEKEDNNKVLRQILSFRIQLKASYAV